MCWIFLYQISEMFRKVVQKMNRKLLSKDKQNHLYRSVYRKAMRKVEVERYLLALDIV